ncbi:MAG: putative addiction module antidote protein [Candidatus Gastranaerophilales bacterium]|nr:putative addiction module antidote protein [Candidatus Gastranaerophilales bacterium]
MRKYDEYLIETLKDSKEAEGYLNASLEAYMEDNDAAALMLSLEHLARAKYSITQVSKQTGIPRQNLYKIFDNETNPNFNTVFILIKSLGFKLIAQNC